MCKQLINDNATDSEIAEYLSIGKISGLAEDFQFIKRSILGEDKVKYFKYKMQLFEDEIRTRKR